MNAGPEAPTDGWDEEAMKSVILLAFVVSVIEASFNDGYLISEEDAGTTVRLTCLFGRKLVNKTSMDFTWKFRGKRIRFSEGAPWNLDDEGRVLVIHDFNRHTSGRYMCVCHMKASRERCPGKWFQKNELHIMPLDHIGCSWIDDTLVTNRILDPKDQQKYHMRCKCDEGAPSEEACGNQIIMQRLDDQTRTWTEVPYGRRVGAISFDRNNRHMVIHGSGSNLTQGGWHRCVGLDSLTREVKCVSDAVVFEVEAPTLPLAQGITTKHVTTYLFPVLGVSAFVISFLVGGIVMLRRNQRIVVEGRRSTMITRHCEESVSSQEDSQSSSQASSQSADSSVSHYSSDIETISTIF